MTILEHEDPEHPERSGLHDPAAGGEGGRRIGGPVDAVAEDDVQALLERALGLPPGSGRVAVAGAAESAPLSVAQTGDPGGAAAALPRPAARVHDRGTARRRLTAGLLLVAALGAAYLVVTRVDTAPATGTSQGTSVTSVATAGTADRTRSDPVGDLLARLPVAWRTSCRSAPGLDEVATGAVSCTPLGGNLARVEMRVFGSPIRMQERYAALAVEDLPPGRTGEPRCASGHREERGWARPERPGSAAGRYACRIEDGFASMWWTADSSGVLVHAVRTDANLAALFDWWRSEAPRALG